MSTRTTNLGPRVSFTTTLSDAGPVYVLVPSTGTFEVDGQCLVDGPLSSKGTVQLGTNGFSFAGLRSSTASVILGTVVEDSIVTAVPITGIASGDPILAIQPDVSIWTGAYNDLALHASSNSGGFVNLTAINSTATAFDTDAMNVTFYWLDLA
jgi:hypothetical protein